MQQRSLKYNFGGKYYGIVVHSAHTDYEEAKLAAKQDDMVQYLICCYVSGYYGDESGVINLVSVAPTEQDILGSIKEVFERYLNS